ncbi:MAG TPA: hypothetical protein VGI71_23645 [Scandinavium sp.]|jgi:hypothetical protein
MFKKLFRLFAGGHAQPKFVRPDISFTCMGINSVLIVTAKINAAPPEILQRLFAASGVTLAFEGEGFGGYVRATGSTRQLSRIHNQLIRREASK